MLENPFVDQEFLSYEEQKETKRNVVIPAFEKATAQQTQSDKPVKPRCNSVDNGDHYHRSHKYISGSRKKKLAFLKKWDIFVNRYQEQQQSGPNSIV